MAQNNRYEVAGLKANKNNKRVLRSILYPPIPNSSSDVYILAAPGTRLDTLASIYYNDVSKWWILAEANSIGKGTFTIEPGLQLRIPINIDKIINEYRELNK